MPRPIQSHMTISVQSHFLRRGHPLAFTKHLLRDSPSIKCHCVLYINTKATATLCMCSLLIGNWIWTLTQKGMCHDFTCPAAVSHVNITIFVYNLINHQLEQLLALLPFLFGLTSNKPQFEHYFYRLVEQIQRPSSTIGCGKRKSRKWGIFCIVQLLCLFYYIKYIRMDEDLTEKQFDFLMEYMNHLQYTVRLKECQHFYPYICYTTTEWW